MNYSNIDIKNKKMPGHKSTCFKGNVSVETGLTVSSLAVACIVILVMFGKDMVNTFIKEANGMPKANTITLGITPDEILDSLNSQPVSQLSGTSFSTSGNGSLVSTDLSINLETLGANGTTMGILSTIEAYAEFYKSTGQIDQPTYNQLASLAKEGYRIATAEKAIEDAMKKSENNTNLFKNTIVQFEGKSYTVEELSNKFGFSAEANRTTGDLFTSFLNLKKQAAGSISDPEAQNIITILSDQILSTSEAFSDAIRYTTSGYTANMSSIYITASSQDKLDDLSTNNIVNTPWNEPLPPSPSSFTSNNSDKICTIGTGNSNVCK